MSRADPPSLWLTVGGTTDADFWDLFSSNAKWSDVEADLTAFKIFGSTVIDDTVAELAQLMVDVSQINGTGVPLIMEWGVLDPVGNAGYGIEGFDTWFPGEIEKLAEAVAYAASVLGVTVSNIADVAMDEPLYFGSISDETYTDSTGKVGYAPQWSISETASKVAAALEAARVYDASIRFGDIEPIPDVTAAEVTTWINDYKADTGEYFAFFQADTVWGASGWLTALEQISAICAADGIPFDILVTGDGWATSATQWTNQALANLISVYLDPNIDYSSLNIENWNSNGATAVLDAELTDGTSGTLTVAARYAAIIGTIAAIYQSVYGRAATSYELFVSTKEVGTNVFTDAELTSTLTGLESLSAALTAYVAAGDALPDAADLVAGVAPGADPSGSVVADAATDATRLGFTLSTTGWFLVPDTSSAVVDLSDMGSPDTLGSLYVYGAAAGSGSTRTLILPHSVVAIVNVMTPAGASAATLTIEGSTWTDFVYLASGDDTFIVGSASENVVDATGTGNSVIEATEADAGLAVQGSDGTVATLAISGAGAVALNAQDTEVTVALNAGSTSVTMGDSKGITVVLAATGQSVVMGRGASDAVDAAASFAGDAVVGSSESSSSLVITSGGTVTLNGADTNLTVDLTASTVLSLGSDADIAVIGSPGNDSITVGALTQSVTTGTGTDIVYATAALAGVSVVGSSQSSSTLEITTNGTETLSNADKNLTIVLASGSNTLTLGSGTALTVDASAGTDAISLVASRATSTVILGNSEAATTLTITSNGVVTLSNQDSNFTIELPSGSNQLTLGTGADIEVVGGSAKVQVTFGALSQSLVAGSGIENLTASAALAGVAITGYSEASTRLYLSSAGAAALSNADSNLTVTLAAGSSSLSMGSGANILAEGSSGSTTLTFTVGNASQSVNGWAGTDTIDATAALASVTVTGGGEANTTLVVTSSGVATLSNADGNLTVSLLVGGNTLNAGSGSNIQVIGSANGAYDTIVLGALSQSVQAGAGVEVVEVTAALAGALIVGASETDTHVHVTTSGSATLNNGDSNLTVYLAAGTSSLNLGTGASIYALGSSSASVLSFTIGNVTQTVNAAYGVDTLYATASLAGATILGLSTASTTLYLTTAGKATLSNQDSNLTVQLTAGVNAISLGTGSFITVIGSSGSDTITAGGANQTLEGAGGSDVLIGYGGGGDVFSGTLSGLAGDTIRNFVSGDLIDITNLASAGASLSWSAGALTISGGGQSTTITLAGSYTAASFSLSSDGGSGTYVHFV